jgi:hypothetical protein
MNTSKVFLLKDRNSSVIIVYNLKVVGLHEKCGPFCDSKEV